MLGRADPTSYDRDPASRSIMNAQTSELNPVAPAVDRTLEFTRCFLRLANLPNFPLDCLSRYEATRGKLAKSSMRSMRWIAANHRSEGAVFNLCSLAH